ncbi:hypothetical protein AAFF_G00217110 [Aldrovandia affinis]|uniref:Btz domain-containing protein n=1 Tax=Aldrovandia affinis TaxID=143900 RepID=A0AAD7SVM8_9TELE|nr:hypothetical protein AAFF_G00217110 [Aldrovandia affinis]
MVRSKSRTHSSRSRSRSHSSSRSRSRSRSRKKRYSSRSRSRSYSRSRSRDRNYPRDYRRDYRMNRGMRRPYGFRNRGRGYYQGGGGRFQHRGGFRPNWHNRRYSRSPRRARSRSRTPKRRSASQRSRSKSPHSERSSASHRSSSSSSSSRSRSPKRRGPQEKAGQEADRAEGNGDQPTVARAPLAKPELTLNISDSWIGIAAYEDGSPRQSPAPTEGTRGIFNSDKQDLQKLGKVFKRYLEEGEGRTFLQERGATSRDGELPPKEKVEWGGAELEPGVKKKAEKPGGGAGEELHRESHWTADGQDEGGKHKAKASKPGRELDRLGEDRVCKFKDPSSALDRLSKDKHAEEGKGRRETSLPRQPKADRLRELITQGPLMQKTVDVKDRGCLRDESPPRVRLVPGEGPRPEVKMKMAPLSFENSSPGTSLTSDRSLASALAQSSKKEQGFRSIFDHIKRPQAFKSSSHSYIQHIVSLVHYVTEHYFKSTGISLHERFTVYQKAAVEHEARHKSPEIHRRIDVSPSAFKKVRVLKGDFKGEKKSKCDSADLRHDIDRRRKERSRDRDDSRGSREPSPSRKLEKVGKEFKDYKDYKSLREESKHKSKERERSGSSSGSSPEDKDRHRGREKEKEEEEGKPHHEQKDYAGHQGGPRARGTFQFRIRGSRGGRGRGVFGGPNPGPSAPNIPFQQRPKEEEWDPEYTPKSRKYFLHDDRDDGFDYWAKRGRGRGLFQHARGRFPFKKASSSPKWTHDKYQGEGNVEEEEDDNNNNNNNNAEGEEKKEQHKEEKVE